MVFLMLSLRPMAAGISQLVHACSSDMQVIGVTEAGGLTKDSP